LVNVLIGKSFLCIGGGYYNKHEKERKIM